MAKSRPTPPTEHSPSPESGHASTGEASGSGSGLRGHRNVILQSHALSL